MEKTIAEQLAHDAVQLSFRDVPEAVVHQVKLSMLDTLGVAFGGYRSEPSRIVQSLVKEMNGLPESTVFGSGIKTSCLNAALANGIMTRYLDYTDRSFLTKEGLNHTGHHGESIPAILAVGEREHSNGREIIVAVVLAYEFLNRVFDSVPEYDALLDKRGWVHETMRTPCIMALVAGRLLGLDEDQMAHGLALAGCFNFELGILNWCEEEVSMARNLRFPYGAYHGIFGALLAQKGFKGPLNVFEGHHGLAEVITGGQMDLEKLSRPRDDWTILNTWIKRYAAGGNMQGLLEATLNIVKEHNLRAEDVAEVKIKTTALTYRILCNPETRRYPENTYTADHSAYYCTAVAILDRAVGPDQFTDERVRDPRVRELANKISIEPDPKLDQISSFGGSGPAIVHIITKKGQTYDCEVLRPKGHPMNPATELDVEEKFRSMAGKFMGERQLKQIIDTVYNLEKLDDIGELVRLLVVQGEDAGQRCAR